MVNNKSDISTLALHQNIRGKLNYFYQRYIPAMIDFESALNLMDTIDEINFEYIIDLGNVLRILNKFSEAEEYYGMVLCNINASHDLRMQIKDEIQKFKLGKQTLISKIICDDERLERIVSNMLINFPKISKPINLWWVDKTEESLKRINDMEDSYKVEENKKIRKMNFEAISHFPRGIEHYIFIMQSRWKQASDTALEGILSHEMVHEELKELGYPQVMPNRKGSPLSQLIDENVTDLISISKGYGESLKQSRKYQESFGVSLDGLTIMSSQEISDYLQSFKLLNAHAKWQMNFAYELSCKINGNSPVKDEEWNKAINLWDQIILIRPDYAFAYSEKGVSYVWLKSYDKARECFQTAKLIDGDNTYYNKKLNEIKDK